MQSSTIHEITTQSENTLGQRATSSRLYSCSIISGPLCSPIVGRLDGLRKDCGGFCQEVERVGSDLNCAGSLWHVRSPIVLGFQGRLRIASGFAGLCQAAGTRWK